MKIYSYPVAPTLYQADKSSYDLGFFEIYSYSDEPGCSGRHHTNFRPILISASWFNMLTPDEQEGVLKAGEEYTRVWNEEIWPEAEAAALETIAEAGCAVNEVDKASFVEATQSVRDDFVDKGTPEQVELYNLLMEVRG